MYDEHDQLDQELARLAESLRSGEHMMACLHLAEFAVMLDHCIHREERELALASERLLRRPELPLAKVQREHASLRRLISAIASALDGADDGRGLELVGKLRSVLLLHVAKEERLQPMFDDPIGSPPT